MKTRWLINLGLLLLVLVTFFYSWTIFQKEPVKSSRFELTNLDKAKNFTIEEKFNYKKMSNNYEQNNYEKTIKKNLASLITRKLILRLKIAE